jgi:hypothetical protein
MSFWTNLESHLNLIPTVAVAIQTMQSIGQTKENAITKAAQIVAVAAQEGEQIPIPVVQAVSATILDIIELVFAQPAKPAVPASTS